MPALLIEQTFSESLQIDTTALAPFFHPRLDPSQSAAPRASSSPRARARRAEPSRSKTLPAFLVSVSPFAGASCRHLPRPRPTHVVLFATNRYEPVVRLAPPGDVRVAGDGRRSRGAQVHQVPGEQGEKRQREEARRRRRGGRLHRRRDDGGRGRGGRPRGDRQDEAELGVGRQVREELQVGGSSVIWVW